MSKIEKILAEIETLTLMEAADLVKAMEEKFGVSAAAAVAVAGPAAGGQQQLTLQQRKVNSTSS